MEFSVFAEDFRGEENRRGGEEPTTSLYSGYLFIASSLSLIAC